MGGRMLAGSTRRRLGLVLAALVAVQLLVLARPALACGCGAVLTPQNTAVADETSLVRFQGTPGAGTPGTEDIVMSLRLAGSPSSAAWFLPVPARPTFALADVDLFNTLAQVTAPRIQVEGGGGHGRGNAAAAPPQPSVTLLQQQTVGPYQVATLAASDGTALHDWLSAHGYQLPAALASAVQPYAAAGWRYVAVRFDPAAGQQTLGSQLPPLRVTFASPQLVYPMRLTRLASTAQTVRIYVLADHRVRSTGSVGPTDSDVGYAGWQDPASTPDALKALLPHRMFLTRFDQAELAPSGVTDDYHFGWAAHDTAYQRVQVVHQGGNGDDLWDDPFSTVFWLVAILVVVAAVLLGVAALVALLVTGRRHRRAGRAPAPPVS
jgi:hypothetical protein